MKRAWIILCVLGIGLCCRAQSYPPEWINYTSGEYLYDLQSDRNDGNRSGTELKAYLLNIARTNLAKQIQVRVQDIARLEKEAVDGRSSISYSSQTTFSTDVELKLVETKSLYDATSKTVYAIACIHRETACNYYNNELAILYNKVGNALVLADNFIAAGFKAKAQAELESALKCWDPIDANLLWINIFGASQAEVVGWQERFNASEQQIKARLADLKHATAIYLVCEADIFGQRSSDLQNKLKGVLAAKGCNFVTTPTNADWVITIRASAREFNAPTTFGVKTYHAYLDATIAIDKVATSQRIYEDTVSEKGSHTLSYRKAARAACNDLSKRLGQTISNTTNL